MAKRIATHCDEKTLDAIFASVDQSHLPGVVAGIALDGVPFYRKGFGRANIELPTLLTPAMRLRIGSTSKHFAALAYMLLCEEGHAGIDDEVGQHVPGLRPVNARATMRQLMGHVSGIRDLLSVTMLFNGIGRPVTDEEMIAYYRTIKDVDFDPGTRWSYNNGGYILLSAAIETITGQRLEDVLRERIFRPVGMHDTVLRRWDQDFLPDSATLHFRNGKGEWSRTYMGMEISGAGGIVSTIDDMLRWLGHMDAPSIGSAQTWRLMHEPQLLANGHSTNYGLGLFTQRYRGVEIIHHPGTVMGGNFQMIAVPEARLHIAIGCNRSDVSAIVLAHSVIDACVEGLEPLPGIRVQEKRTGTFRSPRDGRIIALSARDDTQFLSIDGAAPMPVTPDATGSLQLPSAASFLQQSIRFDGNAIVHGDFGNEDRLVEIDTDLQATLCTYAGTYRSQDMDTTFELSEDGSGAQARSNGRHGWATYKMMPIAANIWRLQDQLSGTIGAVIAFEPDGSGFVLDFGRMRHVRFGKVD
ncbi:serine hydrolase domain-containing protein [Sphingobium sp.]|uniref:serine hydrolase domain-containing protein n=1 Tax=Sphingobium sp. TaxID=1912891 RepID=UPI002B52CC56|nr:serine hydrolase domain-containing protein [Sphingobium sp.]HUD93642.1 serine hydrolase domain-containing protein [Sphingobium sp.]